jgi:hypothetical protein
MMEVCVFNVRSQVQRLNSVVRMFVHYTHTHKLSSVNLKNSFFLFPFVGGSWSDSKRRFVF